MQEGEIERDERSRGAAGGYAGVDFLGGGRGGCGWSGGGVGDAHFGGGEGVEGCGCCCFGGSGGGSVEEEEEEVVKGFGHVMASGCGGCDGGYLVVYIYSFSLSLFSRRGIWQSSLLRTDGRLRSSAVRSDMSAAFLTVRVRQ